MIAIPAIFFVSAGAWVTWYFRENPSAVRPGDLLSIPILFGGAAILAVLLILALRATAPRELRVSDAGISADFHTVGPRTIPWSKQSTQLWLSDLRGQPNFGGAPTTYVKISEFPFFTGPVPVPSQAFDQIVDLATSKGLKVERFSPTQGQAAGAVLIHISATNGGHRAPTGG